MREHSLLATYFPQVTDLLGHCGVFNDAAELASGSREALANSAALTRVCRFYQHYRFASELRPIPLVWRTCDQVRLWRCRLASEVHNGLSHTSEAALKSVHFQGPAAWRGSGIEAAVDGTEYLVDRDNHAAKTYKINLKRRLF